ncbi:MAG: hypothetical protein M5U34_02535 [Chloroflexi bacterium]|nr:hypothetical protein [Chloroflexota bacterium]
MELKSRSVEDVKILELSGRFDTYTAEQVRQWLAKRKRRRTGKYCRQPGGRRFCRFDRISHLSSRR